MKRTVCCGLVALGLVSLPVDSAFASIFASQVVTAQTNGPFGPSPYDDPESVLGKPSTVVYDSWGHENVCVSLAYAAWGQSPEGDKLITTVNSGSQITVKFDHYVLDDPLNWYDRDFTVFGNASFVGNGFVDADTNMEDYMLTTGEVFGEQVTVSVSSNGTDWFTFDSGPFADGYFPTNAFAWDWENDTWGAELDWTKPVDPALTSADFGAISAAEAINRYDGSAGGTSLDLALLSAADYAALDVDPLTGYKYIQYVRVTSSGGEVDGFADVSAVPEPSTFAVFTGGGLLFGTASLLRRRRSSSRGTTDG